MKESQYQEEESRSLSNEQQHSNTNTLLDQSPEAQEAQQLQSLADNSQEEERMWQESLSATGLPADMKAAVEQETGLSLNEIRVVYNSSKPEKLGAHAYAEYPYIYIAPGQEQYLGEELWHLVQQMKGETQVTEEVGGKKVDGDSGREKEARTMGDKMRGGTPQMGQDLVTKKGSGDVVQRAKVEKPSHKGIFSFDDTKYQFINGNQQLDFEIEFKPNATADSTKVGLVQAINRKIGGSSAPLDSNMAEMTTPNGTVIDQITDYRNPLYATGSSEPAAGKDKLETYSTPDGQHGEKKAAGWTSAKIGDKPSVYGGNNSQAMFETSAIALEGTEKGQYYGSIEWGWKQNGAGVLEKVPINIKSMGVPSQEFMKAAEKWNNTKTRGTNVVKHNGTDVLSPLKGTPSFKLQAGDEATQDRAIGLNGKVYIVVTVKTSSADASLIGQTGAIAVEDLSDKGDGKDRVALPLVKVLVPTKANIPLYKDKDKATKDKDLPQNTRMKKLSEDSGMVEVEIVDGADIAKKGWIEKAKLKDE